MLQTSWTWALPWIASVTALTYQCRLFNSAYTHGRSSVLPAPGKLAAMRQRGARLARVGGGDGGEALAVVGGAADALQAKLSVVDGEHNPGPPQPVVVVLVPESASLASGLCTVAGPATATQDSQSTARPWIST